MDFIKLILIYKYKFITTIIIHLLKVYYFWNFSQLFGKKWISKPDIKTMLVIWSLYYNKECLGLSHNVIYNPFNIFRVSWFDQILSIF